MTLDVYKVLFNNPSLYLSLDPFFVKKIKSLIIDKYRSLRKFNEQELKINYGTLKYEFREAEYHPLGRVLQIIKSIGISQKELIENIRGFRLSGSRKNRCIILPRQIAINKGFIEGYALYLAEGDTGFNGKALPRKVRFTNSKIDVIKLFIEWLNAYFPGLDFYLLVIIPFEDITDDHFITTLKKKMSLYCSVIRFRKGYYNKQIKYKVCCDNGILISLILDMEELIKEICIQDKGLASAYIRGMMIGEGTVYFNKSRYVRIEMRNRKEIKYIHSLLQLLNYDCKISLRTNRENMWSIYIGAKQLKKFFDEIGFGVHRERQYILEKAVNKKLRINQYV